MASPGRGNLLLTQELPISLLPSQPKELTPEHGTSPCGLMQRLWQCCTLTTDQSLHKKLYVHYLIYSLSLPSWEDNAIQSLLPGVPSEEIKAEKYDDAKHT